MRRTLLTKNSETDFNILISTIIKQQSELITNFVKDNVIEVDTHLLLNFKSDTYLNLEKDWINTYAIVPKTEKKNLTLEYLKKSTYPLMEIYYNYFTGEINANYLP